MNTCNGITFQFTPTKNLERDVEQLAYYLRATLPPMTIHRLQVRLKAQRGKHGLSNSRSQQETDHGEVPQSGPGCLVS
jgi:hypothetical protein